MSHNRDPKTCPEPCPECAAEALQVVFEALRTLSHSERVNVLRAVSILFDIEAVD